MTANGKTFVRQALKRFRAGQIYNQFKDFTMIPKSCFIDNLLLAGRAKTLAGCVVECGVWRGGMSAGMARVLGPHRHYFLFDSFEGLPPAKNVDGPSALAWQQDKMSPTYFGNCSASEEFAERAMQLAGARAFSLVKGWFEQTLGTFVPPEPIAVLRLDADWYESTTTCLESLYGQVRPGGLIIIDDYNTWDGCSRAVHDFLSKKRATERIDRFNSVSFLEKRDDKERTF